MKRYQQLSSFERLVVSMLYKRGDPVADIADYLGRHRSTLYRELTRNGDPCGFYSPRSAHQMALSRRQREAPKQRERRLRKYVDRGLANGWSPEQMAGRMKRLERPYGACTETIYQLVYGAYGRQRGWPRRLPQAKPKRGAIRARKRAKYLNLRPISKRPQAANQRREFGHWEGDSVHFRVSKNRRHVTTLVERKTRYSLAILQQEMISETVMTHIKERFTKQPVVACKSLTLDQGTEFAYYQVLERSTRRARRRMTTYYCDVKSPWQKGGNENFNGRLRRFLPRDFNIHQLSEQQLEEIVKMMNKTPRKCLGFQTPTEAYRNACRTSR